MDNTGKNMKEILKKVYYLERINYEQGKMINCLSQRCLELERDKKRELPLENYVSASIDSETIIGMAMFGAVTGAIVLVCLGIFTRFSVKGFFGPLLSANLIGALIGVILGLLVEQMKAWDADDKNKQVTKHNDRVVRENAKRVEKIRKQIDEVRKEYLIVCDNQKETQQILNNFYSKNIIYPKYRGLVPIAAFYEYFNSGICDTLTGHEGAYNIYETEIRMNIIIAKLDDVIYRLDEIRDRQYALYDAIENADVVVNNMNNTINGLVGNMKSVVDNQNVIAYNTRIAAENTAFLSWMEMIK